MRICVTVNSDNPVIDEIYYYCQTNGIDMFPSSYIHVGDSYWLWRIEAEPSRQLTWLMLHWSEHLAVF
jgi:hypothetical protein